ncbi:MAG: hypothetical protein IJT49_08695 [Clostridia bacterium]|nr:hypothetical protein [Clostridia bacterium]
MKKANVILLAGQSNAVGCAEVRFLPDHFPAQRIKKWRDGFENIKINYYSHDKKSNGFEKTTFNCTVLEDDTFGLEVGIAEALDEKYPGQEFFVVKCAFGGVTLYNDFISPSADKKYDPLSYADQKEDAAKALMAGESFRAGWCYNEFVKIISESIRILEGKGYLPEIKALCWMQGESDANNEDATVSYAYNYDAFLRDIKAAFAKYIDGCVFIDAGISTVWERYERMNEIKRKYAEKRSDCVFIDTIGAGLSTMKEPPEEPDIGHYDSDSLIKLGRMFADNI